MEPRDNKKEKIREPYSPTHTPNPPQDINPSHTPEKDKNDISDGRKKKERRHQNLDGKMEKIKEPFSPTNTPNPPQDINPSHSPEKDKNDISDGQKKKKEGTKKKS